MPRKSNKRINKGKKTRTRKQKKIVMIGCSKKNKKSYKNNKVFSTLGNKGCPNCGPNCPHPCPGNCYLNRRMKKHRGGGHGNGCGSCGCPVGGLTWEKMKQFGGNMGSYPEVLDKRVMGDGPILGINQNGGSCSACGQTPVIPNQLGGNFFKQIGAMPGPFVGSPLTQNNLPGEKGIGGDANYYKLNINNNPQNQTSMNNSGYLRKNSMVGGYIYKKSSKSSPTSYSKRGGGLIPQDLVNLGRDFSYNFKTAYNALNGYNAPVNPAPYKGQLTRALNNNRFML